MKDQQMTKKKIHDLEQQETLACVDAMDENGVFHLFRKAAELFSSCMNDYLYVYDITNDTYYITERATERFDLPGSIFHHVVEGHRQFVYPDDLTMLQKDLDDLISGRKNKHNLRYRWMSIDREPVWINCQGRTFRMKDQNVFLMIGCINEIGEKTKADNVSGLLGEVSFEEQLHQFRGLPRCFIMRFGIDDFKNINESLGVNYGDHVIYDVANCITECLQPGQYVYRMPADEFVVFDLLSESRKEVKQLYDLIRCHIDDHIAEHEYEALYTVSCGVISYEDIDSLDYEQITKLSQFALTRAKERGKNQLNFFNGAEYETFVANRRMTRNLQRAVSKEYRGFELYFQPIVKTGTGEVFAAEALLRYRNEEGELIPPSRFIEQLEESGLIVPVGRWIIHAALQACVACQQYRPDFKVSINFSFVQILKSPIYDDLIGAIEKYHLRPESVIVELTESGYLESNKAVVNLWRKLKEYGVQVALDDFGTGYSNLMNISQMQPDILKIDREFTVKALRDDYAYRLLVQIIEMVHSLDIKEVVEGIEQEEELERIAVLGPDYIQGYFYSAPCSIPEFMDKFVCDQSAV